MRDDIHKSAPVAKAWRSLMRHCAREADRKERAANTAYRAISEDCGRELSHRFLSKLMQQLSPSQKTLFSDVSASLTGSCFHVLEREVVSHLRRREACGEKGGGAVAGALADAIKGRLNSTFVAMKGHWLKHGGRDAGVPIEVAKTVISALPVGQLVNEILTGQKPSRGMSKPSPVDLDEDLR